MNAPCTDGDKDDWQKAVVALSRAAGGYSALMVEAGGNRAEAASLLWKRSRHDEALREDLVKAACALLALAPPVARHEGEAPALGWRRRPGRLSKCDLDPEVAAFVRERLGTMPVIKIAAEVLARFGPDRAPRKTAICRYWQRLDEERCAT